MILELSGFLGLWVLIAKMADLGSIWSHLGIHFGSHFGAKSAQEEPRWAQEEHNETQSSENVQLQKPRKTIGFSRFLQMQVFCSLKLLMVLLGPSWLLLGRSGPKMTSKMGPQIAPNRS